jgi:hypothetical protein
MQTMFNRRVWLVLCLAVSAGTVCRGRETASLSSASLAGVAVATRLDTAAQAELEKGGRVILFPERIGRAHPPVSFVSIFWNDQLFPNDRCQTLGLLCDPKRPALTRFPTCAHSEWIWESIVHGARPTVCRKATSR